MNNTWQQKIESINWQSGQVELNDKGYTLIEDLLTADECAALRSWYSHDKLFRKTIQMERYRFGAGQYKYFRYPLPSPIETIRELVYKQLVPVANKWMHALHMERQFPDNWNQMQLLSKQHQQLHPTVLILKYGKGGHNTLHQDLYGELFFPFQAVIFLSDPDKEYSGGEFVMIQQNPRAQSKAIVLRPNQGSMLVFTTNFRPVAGNRGFYRVAMKHGVSEIHSGERYTLGIIFHDALS